MGAAEQSVDVLRGSAASQLLLIQQSLGLRHCDCGRFLQLKPVVGTDHGHVSETTSGLREGQFPPAWQPDVREAKSPKLFNSVTQSVVGKLIRMIAGGLKQRRAGGNTLHLWADLVHSV